MKRHAAAFAGDLLRMDTVKERPWLVEQMRCTAFLLPLFDVSAEAVFKTVADSDPLLLSANRQQAVETASGLLGDFKLDVVKNPGRLDIVLQPKEEPVQTPTIDALGPWSEIVEVFSGSVHRWLRTHPQLQRLALGAIVTDEVKDRMTGYRLLNELLPMVEIDVEHSSDFLYQINRPRLATFENAKSLKINRLSKWSVAQVMVRTLRFSAKEPLQRATNVLGSVRNYCRAELDLSTDAETMELRGGDLEAIWETLVSFAREMLVKGDIP
jgi:hypothetical protein